MAKFDDVLSALHQGKAGNPADIASVDTNIIEVNTKRQFVLKDFDPIIAYEGDVNSQIITFKLPASHDSHALRDCEHKELKWKNLASRMEGNSDLLSSSLSNTDNNYFYVTWNVPPELCTEAGQIEISISCYDLKDDQIAFSWNTSKYTGLLVGSSMDSVGNASQTKFPAKDEILVIDKETKNIIAPVGYNNVVSVYGDVGMSSVYFLVNRYLGKGNVLDVLDNNVIITIYILYNKHKKKAFIELKQPYTVEIEGKINDSLVLMEWPIPAELSAGELGAHQFDIAIEFGKYDADLTPIQRWISNKYTSLKIGESLIQTEVNPDDEPVEEVITEEDVYYFIDKYFKANEIVWDANE